MSDLYRSFLTGEGRTRPMVKWHHYFPIYEQWFSHFRRREAVMVEIGVMDGGSLQMWRHWLGPKARIVGIDIDPECRKFADDGIEVFIGDQADPGFLRHVLAQIGTPDIVLDDGGHSANQTITSFETLYPAMQPHGVYAVEDTHAAFWSGNQDRADGLSFLMFAVQKMTQLYDWTRIPENFDALLRPPAMRPDLPASEFCRSTKGIYFYDSIVVFEREPREAPWQERR